jgi:hypothetical protein
LLLKLRVLVQIVALILRRRGHGGS